MIRRAAGLGALPTRARSRPLRPKRMPFATCWSSAAARPAWPRRWPPAAPARASSLPTRTSLLGGRLLAERHEIDGMPCRDMGADRRGRTGRRCPTSRILPPHARCSAPTTAATIGALERVSDHLAAPPPHQPRQRLWQIVAKRAVLATGADRAAARVRRQRPARRDDGVGRAHLSQPLRASRRAGAPRSSPPATTAGARRPICSRPASRSRRSIDARTRCRHRRGDRRSARPASRS